MLLRRVAEERRRTGAEAMARGDKLGAEAAQRDLRRVNAQQARLASALWHAQDAAAACCETPVQSQDAAATAGGIAQGCALEGGAIALPAVSTKFEMESPEGEAPMLCPAATASASGKVQTGDSEAPLEASKHRETESPEGEAAITGMAAPPSEHTIPQEIGQS